ncbi:hypothetical protein [Caulobacter segnis]|uniref:Uncharacterized protein n=1 Tax=Caulobacter segnis TaxID=88688 RepID=A0A2W5VD51_9CAUL|nr:hypothetical protein [Caulobacter segnis]PZR37182.1 MAG: hypothetical protein DI526_01310 [Caulobacter segnis]
MFIAKTDSAGVWQGEISEVADDAVCPAGWRIVSAAPPMLAPGQVAAWAGSAWEIVPEAERPTSLSKTPLRIAKIDFSRLFTTDELVAYLALEAQAKSLTPADFADPTKTALVQAAVMFAKFGMLPDLIELDHPETIAGVSQVLVANGVLTAAEAARILANVPPSA